MVQKLFAAIIIGVLALVFGLNVMTSQAPTVHDSMDTTAGHALENVSASAKTFYGFGDLIWVAVIILFLVGIGFGIATGKLHA